MMKKFIRQKNRNNKAMGMMLLAAVLFLSVFYAALYSVIYMFGSGSVEVESGNLYYKVSEDSNEQSDGGKFYKFCDKEGNVSSDTGLTTMSAAMKAMSGGGNIYMLSSYEPKSSDETVTVPQKSVTIQRFIKVDNGVEQASFQGPLFDIKKDFKIEVSNNETQFAISGSEFQCASGAFAVSENAVLTLNNSTSGLNPGVFIIDNNYCSSNGGAINLTKGSLVANSIQFKNNRCVNASGGVCGGAICSQESKIDISNCKFTDNTVKGKSSGTSGFGGGAVYIGNGSSGVMKNCEVTGNKSYFSSRAGAGVYVEASENSFALSGSTIIKDNTCCYSDENTQSDLSVNDNLHLRGGIDNSNNNVNISINTSGLLEGSEILVNTNPSLSENDDLRALISDSGCQASYTEYFKSDIKGYKPAIESEALYLVFSPEYDELWYGEKTVKGSDGSTSTYKSFFSDENLANDTGFTHLRDAVGIIKTNGKIHMLTSYVSSVDETVNVPKAKVVNIVRESTFNSDSMFKITGGTFTVNATDPNSSIIFDGQKIETSVGNGCAFYVDGGSIKLNGAEKSDGGKTITIQNNVIFSSKDTSGGGVYISGSGTNMLTNCSITGNTASTSSAYADGGGVYISGSGTNILTNCSITGNTASPSSYSAAVYGGGVYISSSGTNTLTNCSITGNTASSSAAANGGGVYISNGTNTLTNCSMTGNTASSTSSSTSFSVRGGGVYISDGTNTLLDTMNITGNTTVVKSNTSDSNMYCYNGNTVALSDGNGKALSTGSKIGVKTSTSPTEGNFIQFATSATEDMKSCFTPDEAGVGVYYENGGLYLEYIYDTIYQKGNAFYTDEACSNAINGVTTLARAVEIAQKIVFVGSYEVTSDETVTIPAGRTVTLLRYANFKNISMLGLASGGTFTFNAPSASSKLIMDGNNVNTTGAKGAMIYINNDSNNKFVLKGCSESNRNIEVKNFHTSYNQGSGGAICNDGGGAIDIQNCKFTSNYANDNQGGAIYSSGGSEESVIKNCEFSDNHALNGNSEGHSGGALFLDGGTHVVSNCDFYNNSSENLHAGALFINAGTNTIESCTFENNSAKWGGAMAFNGGTNNITNCVMRKNYSTDAGGAVNDYEGVNTYTDCTIEENTASSLVCGGICVNNQSNNVVTFAGKMTIINNKATSGESNAYCCTSKIMVLASNFSTESKIGVTVESTDYPVMFAMGATEAMKKCFSTDETDKAILYYGSGRLYITKAYDTIYQKDHLFYTDEACSNTISNITTLERAVEIAQTIVFVGSYEVTSDETVTIPADKTVTLLRSTNFTNISMFGLNGVTLTLAAPDPNSKLIIDGNNIETTGAKGSMIYIDSNSSNKLVLKGCSESNRNIEVRNFRTAMNDSTYGIGDGGAICIFKVGAVDAQNCKFTGNYSNYGQGGAIYGGAGGTINIQNCTFTGNYTKKDRGGAICSHGSSTESTIKNCEFSDNHALNGAAGGTISIEEGTHTISNCNFHDNASESASAGGIFVYGGTNRIESCTFKNNSAQWGGAVAIEKGTNVMKDCTITGNTASTFGGGIYISNGTNALTGVMTITDNVCPKGKNLYLYASRVFSLKDGSTSLSEGSNVGITTEVAPAENAPVQFAESATESMKALFTADKANSEVIYQNGKLYLGYTFSTCFYKDGTFYTDEDCTNSTGISKLSDLMSKIQIQNSRIYMMSCYNSSGDETTYVPSSKNITVLRHGSFTNNSMFSVTGGTFKIDATDPTSSITFDGNGVGVSINTGGAFKVNSGSINLSGAEKSGGGKTITIQDNVVSSSGGGIYIRSGTNTMTNCSITGNTASSSSAFGGGVCIDDGTNTLTNCSITGNTASSSAAFARGGGVYIGSGTNTLTNCSITGNTVSASLSVSATAYGGGVYLNTGTNTLLGTMNITGNTAKVGSISSDNNLYLQSNYTVALSVSDGNTLSTSSKIGVSTSSAPTSSRSVQFATGATSAMASCFTPDNSSYKVTYRNSDAALSLAVK